MYLHRVKHLNKSMYINVVQVFACIMCGDVIIYTIYKLKSHQHSMTGI